jgi:hypothetical protein
MFAVTRWKLVAAPLMLAAFGNAALGQMTIDSVTLPAHSVYCAESADMDSVMVANPQAAAVIFQALDTVIVSEAAVSKVGSMGLPYATVRETTITAPANGASAPAPSPTWRVMVCAAIAPSAPQPLATSSVKMIQRPAFAALVTLCATDAATESACRAALVATAGLPSAPDEELRATYAWMHIEAIEDASVATAAIKSFSDVTRRVVDDHTMRVSPPDARVVMALLR